MKKVLKINLGGEYIDHNGFPKRTKLFKEVVIHKYDGLLDELTIGDSIIDDKGKIIRINSRTYDYKNNICILFDESNHWINIDVEEALNNDYLLDYLISEFEK